MGRHVTDNDEIFCSSCLFAHWFCSYSSTTEYRLSQPIILFEVLEWRHRNQHFWWYHIWGRGVGVWWRLMMKGERVENGQTIDDVICGWPHYKRLRGDMIMVFKIVTGVIDSMVSCNLTITNVSNWMPSNFLSLNPSKTEFLIFGLPQQLS